MPRTVRPQPEPSRRDSWPPTQISLCRSMEADETASTTKAAAHTDPPRRSSLIEDDPLTSFLTPTPLLDDGDTDDDMDFDDDLGAMDMTLDAGIENPRRPAPVIRSISPSKLAGGLRSPTRSPPLRTITPPHFTRGSMSPPSRNSPEICTPDTAVYDDDEEDDGEDYVRFTPRGLGLVGYNNNNNHIANMSSLNNYFGNFKSYAKARKASKSAAVAAAKLREKEQDRIALAMVRGGYVLPIADLDYSSDYYDNYYNNNNRHHHHNNNSNSNTMFLAPAPMIHPGRSLTGSTRGRSSPPTLSSPSPRLPHRSMSSGSSGSGSSSSWSIAMAANIPISGRTSPRAWREPSPDVWSIEEDAEGEVLDEMKPDARAVVERTKPKGKGKGKKVRFAMPLRVEIP